MTLQMKTKLFDIRESHILCFLFGLLLSTISGQLTAAHLQNAAKHNAAQQVVYVGVREDAKPFSYRATDGAKEPILAGFGGFMVEVCRHVLKQMKEMPDYQHLQFRALATNAADRFAELDAHGHFLMLCGPDSITRKRMKNYRASHPLFKSGMTYAYLNPRSPKFPRAAYCSHIIGVVRGTTADLQGLDDLAGRDILMRFDSAVDLELNKTHERLESADKLMRDLIVAEISKLEKKLRNRNRNRNRNRLSIRSRRASCTTQSKKPIHNKYSSQQAIQSRTIRKAAEPYAG